MRKINSKQAQQIIDSACSTWKDKLATKWAVDVVKGQTINVDEAFYKEMRSACTQDQNKLFDEIFGKDQKEIEWDKLKTGSKVMIKYTGRHVEGIEKIDTTKPVDIVLYKTRHGITEDKEFREYTYHQHYITFHQNTKYCVFASDIITDYIVDVIEY